MLGATHSAEVTRKELCPFASNVNERLPHHFIMSVVAGIRDKSKQLECLWVTI
jgi:hypothetical protein